MTQTISKVNVPPTVTGTGSVTATPTSYTTAVTTTASTTTAVSDGRHQDSSAVLGKRPRKASTKYEDLEQPSPPVGFLGNIVLHRCLVDILVHLSVN